MPTKLDSRQVISRDVLDQIAVSSGTELDNILRSINNNETAPLSLSVAGTNRVVNIGSIFVTNPETNKNKTIPTIGNALPAFTSGTITAPATGSGTITVSAGTSLVIAMTASQFLKIGINIDNVGNISLTSGVAGASLAAATAPSAAANTFSPGYVVLRTDGSNNMANILSSDLYQYVGGGGGGGSGSSSSTEIIQANTFSVGNLVYLNGSTYTLAKADAANTSSVVGMVSVATSTRFTMVTTGLVTGLSGLTVGSDYFLDATTAGLATLTEPSVIGQVSLPIGIAASATSMYIDIKRGITVGGVNARTTVNLNNNSINLIQNASAWISGELTGWVTIAATTPLRFFVRAPFAKNGAGTDYNISPSYVGDTVPVGFTTTITSGGLIQMTLPTITGYTSASVNFSVDAPAVGATFPLQISSNNITFQEPTMFRNRIINGNFDIWQRGTSHSANGYGSADRWQLGITGSTATMSRQTHTLGQTDVPNNPKYFMRNVVTSSAGASNFAIFRQNIENVTNFAGQTVTVSFYAKADAAKPISIEASQSFGSGGSPSATVTGVGSKVTLSTIFTRYTVQIAIPSIAGKTLGTNGDDYLQINFWLDAGSSFDTRTNTLGQQSGTFDISSVQIEQGTIATPFEVRPYGTELALCQRYFYSAHNSLALISGAASTTAALYMRYVLPVTPRVAPTVSFSGVGIGNTFTITDDYVNDYGVTTAPTISQPVSLSTGVTGRINLSGFTGLLTIGRIYNGCENVASTARILFSMEL